MKISLFYITFNMYASIYNIDKLNKYFCVFSRNIKITISIIFITFKDIIRCICKWK